MEYYPLLKRNEVLIYTTTWLNFENFMLNEISQTQDKYCMISLYKMLRIGKFINIEVD